MKKLILAMLAMFALSAIADARPGGGHSSSGGGRSSSSSRSSGGGYRSSGGGGGGGGSIEGLILVVVICVIVAVVQGAKKMQADWSTATPPYLQTYEPPPPPTATSVLSALKQRDPDLSIPALEDFIFQLYAAAQRARDNPAALAKLAPYIDAYATSQLAARGVAPSQIVIGTLKIMEFGPAADAGFDLLSARIEATLHTSPPSYVVEKWSFRRSQAVTSKPPQASYTWPCPNCGAPWEGGEDRKCQHCGETMTTGKFDWSLVWTEIESEKPVLASLTGTVEEYGNDLPTIYRADAAQQMQAITADDPQVTFEAVRARVALIYARLNEGWNASNLAPVRGLTTTALRDYMQYWLDEYKRQGLSNQLANASISYIELAKVVRDRHFDAITMRVRAGGCDYTLDKGGSLVGGSKTKIREYTEYWTVLRSSARRGPVNNTASCPNCGAALAISDSGKCTHCDAAVENGQFDWVLSKIEQDDTYTG